MKSFSQRKGLKPTKSAVQIDSMDDALRNSLWTALVLHYWEPIEAGRIPEGKGWHIMRSLWIDHFKKPVDEVSSFFPVSTYKVKDIFNRCEWYEVYDLIEFVANQFPDESVNGQFMEFCNSVLEKEQSAYRFVGGRIAHITAEEEISEIEKALEASKPLDAVYTHLNVALDHFSDKKSPDYRNCIKESISAVESLLKIIVQDDKLSFSKALKRLPSNFALHPAFIKAIDSLYGYASDAGGIRHGSPEMAPVHSEDARFVMVWCSALVNYFVAKALKAQITL